MKRSIIIRVIVKASTEVTWECFTDPRHVVNWSFSAEDWHCPNAETDLVVGGFYTVRMEAKDGSKGFDLKAEYTEIIPCELLAYRLDDGSHGRVTFKPNASETVVILKFEPGEESTPPRVEYADWRVILDNFKRYVEREYVE